MEKQDPSQVSMLTYVNGQGFLAGKSPVQRPYTAIPVQDPAKIMQVSQVSQVLAERGKRYGIFSEHARITQNIKRAMEDSPNWKSLAPDQREALEMIAHKVGRILNGDPNYDDSWVDIAGYTTLVSKRLQGESL